MLLTLTWRNVWRNKVRSLVIMLAIAIGVWAGLFLIAFSWGMNSQRINDALEKEISHIQIHHQRYRDDENLKYFIKSGSDMMSEIRKIPEIIHSTSRLISTGMISSSRTATGVKINGIVPKEEASITYLAQKLSGGKYFSRTGKESHHHLSKTR